MKAEQTLLRIFAVAANYKFSMQIQLLVAACRAAPNQTQPQDSYDPPAQLNQA